MINYITKWWRASKENDRLANINKKRAEFYIKEKDGALWIVHEGTAVDMIPPFASSEEIVQMLEETRCCAVEYAYGVYSEGKDKELKQADARVIENPFYVKHDLGVTPV